MNKKMLFNMSAALAFSVGLSVSGFAQESTPTPAPTPIETPSPSPAPSAMPSPSVSPTPTEEPKKAEAVTPPVDTQKVDNQKKSETNTVSSTYEVPLLGVSGFKQNETSEIAINFSGELQGLKGKAYIKPNKDGSTQIKMRFDDMKMAPKNKRFVLWAVAPDKTYTKIGQVINSGEKQESEIRGETALKDFGLFVTQEESDVTTPTGTTYAPFKPGM